MKNKRDKTLLILGGGFGQLPAIYKAKDLKIHTIVVDKNLNCLGAKIADEFYPIDIISKVEILQLAKEKNIDGIMTMQTDLPVPIIGFVNDQLDLMGVNYECAKDCSIKTNTRLKLESKKITQPIFRIVSNIDEATKASVEIEYPVIIKAIDSSGSRGVTKVNNQSEVEEGFREALKNSRAKEVLVEEFIDGIEIGAQAFCENGKCVKVLIHNDTLAKGKYMVPTGHSFPSFLNKKQMDFARENIIECVEALGIENGPSNIDLILDKKDGKVKIIEVGARIGATCLPELVHHYSGIDWVEMTILNALGVKIDLVQNQETPVAAEILEAPKDGILKQISIPQEVKDHPQLLEIEVTAEIGDQVSILKKCTDRIGKIVVKGSDYKEAEKLAKQLKSKIIFKIELS